MGTEEAIDNDRRGEKKGKEQRVSKREQESAVLRDWGRRETTMLWTRQKERTE